jgi:hypothetical protein
MNTNKAWRPEDEEMLRNLAGQGVSLARISIRLKRNQNAVRFKATQLGLAVVTRSQLRQSFGLKPRGEWRAG